MAIRVVTTFVEGVNNASILRSESSDSGDSALYVTNDISMS